MKYNEKILMDKNTAIEILGKTGEKIIANMFNSEGRKVQYAIDNFDSQKDFIVDGKMVEVKTEQPYVLKNAITIRKTQLRKCKAVDELYFISVPPLFKKDYKWGGWIFKVDSKTFNYSNYTTKSGNNMIEIPIEQEAISKVRKLTNEELFELMKYVTSAYTR